MEDNADDMPNQPSEDSSNEEAKEQLSKLSSPNKITAYSLT